MSSASANSVPVNPVALTGVNGVDSLIMGAKWGGVTGTGVALTYSFPMMGSYWLNSYLPYEPSDLFFRGLIASEQLAAQSAMTAWSNVANITFTQVADNISTVGEIRFAWSGYDVYSAQAHAYFPSSDPRAGDVWLNDFPGVSWTNAFNAGSYGYMTLLHELGHALGLKHSFQATGVSDAVLPANADGYPFTLMSYSAYPGLSGSTVNFNPTTPMAYDIQAIQYLYGANTSYHSGDDVYVFNQGQSYFQTIWDGGGTDEIMWNGTTESATIDLRPGHWSDLGNALTYSNDAGSVVATSNYTVNIYTTVTIEKAAGGAANDTLYGNDIDNNLNGGSGNDLMYGFAGDDFFDWDPSYRGGADTMYGGLGNDVFVVDSTDDFVFENVDEGSDLIWSEVSFSLATVLNVENLSLFGNEFVDAFGNDLNNILKGNAAANVLNGGAGSDSLVGGAGDDSYIVDVATDVITELASEGTDQVNVGLTAAGTYVLSVNVENATVTANPALAVNVTGNLSNNVLTGNAGNNTLLGLAGADTLYAGTGVDIVDGGTESDTLVVLDVFADYIRSRPNALDTLLVNAGTGENITLRGIEAVHFTDGIKTLAEVQFNVASTSDDNLQGTTGADSIDGLAGNDTIGGLGGNDTLIGGVGNDSLIGGTGDDTYVVDVATDVITELAGEGTDQVNVAFTAVGTYVLSANVENATVTAAATLGVGITGNAENNSLIGNAAANTLIGLGGNDTLNGLAGVDSLVGGAGDDTYIVDVATDVIIELAGEGTDNVQSSITYTLSVLANIENLTLIGSATINATGNALANVLTGNSANNILDGGVGIDTLIGGLGSDTYMVDVANDVITELAGEGIEQVNVGFIAVGSYVLSDNVENATVTAAATVAVGVTGNAENNILSGNAAANILIGLGGNDTLIGGVGIDSLIGGTGDDLYVVDVATDVITELAGEGTDQVNVGFTAVGSYVLSANVENATVTAAATLAVGVTGNAENNSLTGNAAANTLIGLGGNDTLNGLAGVDSLVGGVGDDTYIVDVATDVITELASEGTDQVNVGLTAAGTYVLSVNVENATVTANPALAVNVTGNASNNTLTGNAGNNTLLGLAGADTLYAGTGVDIVDGGTESDTLVVLDVFADYTVTRLSETDTRLVNAGTGENITLRGIETVQFTDGPKTMSDLWNNLITTLSDSIVGTPGADSIDGLAGNDTISGLGGNDTLIGGVGIDSLIGGTGDDLYVVDVATDVITELAGEGTDQVNVGFTAVGSYVLSANVENATVTAAATLAVGVTGNAENNSLTGNAAANTLIGLGGNDTLNGLAGVDSLVGGVGDDTYIVDVATDVITELASEGTDQVNVGLTAAGTYVLSVNVENATVTANPALAVNVTGNASNNTLTGNAGNNTLLGLAGADTFAGGGGSDTVDGGDGTDTLVLDGMLNDYVLSRPSATQTTITSSVDGSVVTVSNLETLFFAGDASSVTLSDLIGGIGSTGNDTLSGSAQDDILDGGLGNDSLIGGAGDDYLLGGDGLDTLVGGLGSDVLDGGLGTDTYQFAIGSGDDVIEQSDAVAGSIDTVELASPIGNLTTGQTSLSRGWFSMDDVVISVQTGAPGAEVLDHIVVKDFFIGDLVNAGGAIDQIRFLVDGTVLTQAQILTELLKGTAGDDLLMGYANSNDTIAGGLGDDTLTGAAGNDSLDGGAGADQLGGGDGNDTLIGGLGNDTLMGGAGSDTYVFGQGGGVDYISDGGLKADSDILKFGTGITAANLIVRRSGDDLSVNFTTSKEQLWIHNYFTDAGQIEKFTFSNGTSWTAAMIQSKVMVPTNGDDYIVGTLGNDSLQGLAGTDSLFGGAGNDRLSGGDGSDYLQGDTGSDWLNGGNGVDWLNGGVGADRFIFDTADALTNADWIYDLNLGWDQIALSLSVFGGLGVVGATIGLNEHLLYVPYNDGSGRGALQYDADGVGGNAAVTFVHLSGISGNWGTDFILIA